MQHPPTWLGLPLSIALGLGAACDSGAKKPKKSLAETEAESYANATTETLDAYQEVFERLAERVRGDVYEHKPCDAELTASLEGGVWLNASTLALTESALRWFAETPRTKSSGAEAPVGWAQGAEGYLNDFGLATPGNSGLDGGRLAFLREARLFEQHGATDDRTVGVLKSRFIHRFATDHRKAPSYVLLLRGAEWTQPKAPEQLARTEDELRMDALSRDIAKMNAKNGATPDLDAALNPPPTHSETTFVGGQVRGMLEVYDASTGKRLCGHSITAKNSAKIKSYYSGAKAVHADLSDNFVTAANAAFSTPLRKVHKPKD